MKTLSLTANSFECEEITCSDETAIKHVREIEVYNSLTVGKLS